MHSIHILLFSLLLFSLSACNSTPRSTNSSSPSSPELTTQTKSTIDLTNTDQWSRFSFSHLSIDLPANWKVSSLSDDHRQIQLETFPYSGTHHPAFSLTISQTNQSISNTNTQIAGYPALDNSPTTTIQDPNQNLAYTFTFSNTQDYPEFTQLALSTLQFKSRGRL